MALVAWLAPGAVAFAQATKASPAPAKEQAKPKAGAPAKELVDLNSATSEELMTLPGIGEAISRKIIDTRPHKAVADLGQHGVPARTIDGLKGHAVVRPLPAPVEVNSDPIDRLETLPGIGLALAKEIVAGRPYASYDDLAKLKGFGAAKVDGLKGRVKFTHAATTPKAMPKAKADTPAPAPDEKKKAMPKGAATAGPRPKADPATREPAAAKPAAGALVNLNKASKEELDALPGIGPVKAQAIVDARPFATIEDVMKVKGIKEGEFGKIKNLITVK